MIKSRVHAIFNCVVINQSYLSFFTFIQTPIEMICRPFSCKGGYSLVKLHSAREG